MAERAIIALSNHMVDIEEYQWYVDMRKKK